MESKTEWAKYALAGGLALVTIGGLYYMFSGGKTEEEIEEEEDGPQNPKTPKPRR
jgi:hypothetical protein